MWPASQGQQRRSPRKYSIDSSPPNNFRYSRLHRQTSETDWASSRGQFTRNLTAILAGHFVPQALRGLSLMACLVLLLGLFQMHVPECRCVPPLGCGRITQGPQGECCPLVWSDDIAPKKKKKKGERRKTKKRNPAPRGYMIRT